MNHPVARDPDPITPARRPPGCAPPPGHSVARYFDPDGTGRVYRIALLGEVGSGKTCLLAALGADRSPPDPEGFTCHRERTLPGTSAAVKPGRPTPDEIRRDPSAAFRAAAESLGEAERLLARGDQPEATGHTEPPLLAVYQFTAPGRGQMTVEVAEYSGELLRPETADARNRELLGALVAAADAVVVLADVPRRDQAPAGGPALRYLLGALHAWATGGRVGSRVPRPVAVVFTKWDRRVRAGASEAEHRAELDVVGRELAGNLVDAVRGVGVSVGVFAASAFGMHTTRFGAGGRADPGADRPVGFPRTSYGVNAPFVWACGECDRLACEELAARKAGLRWWRPWWFRSAQRPAALACQLLARTPDGSPPHAEAVGVAARAARLARVQSLLLALILVGAWVGAEWTADAVRRGKVEQALADPAASDEQFDASVGWLREYAGSPWYRHVASKWSLPRAEAGRRAADAVAAREGRAWAEVTKTAGSDAVRNPLLEHYLRAYPGGAHADEARKLLAESGHRLGTERERVRRRAAVGRVRENFARPGTAGSAAAVEALRKELQGLPPPEPGVETPDDLAARDRLRDEVYAELGRLAADGRRKEWIDVERRVEDAIARFELETAAGLLDGCRIDLPEVRHAKGEFGKRAADAAVRRAHAAGATGRVGEVEDTLARIEAAVGDRAFNGLVDAAVVNALSDRRRELLRRKDEILYADFRHAPSDEQAEAYLRGAPLQSMTAAVKAYQAYRQARTSPQNLRLVVQFHWGDWPGGANDVTVEVYEHEPAPGWKPLISSRVESARGTTSGEVTSGLFPARPDRTLGFDVRVDEVQSGLDPTRKARAGVRVEPGKARTAEELATPKEFDLEQRRGANREARVSVRVVGLPQFPDLPPWKER